MEDRPAPDPAKLLAQWMEWERGEATPGRVMANLKTGGLRILLEALAAAGDIAEPAPVEVETASWTPIV
ncbi:MAG: hypothetical protein M3083_06575 [Actinomycetota bacterium]|nr:hypothetical protein [Actinomycetota bacterium]